MQTKAQPYFSIVIPTYNHAYSLEATIKIILHQTFKNFEIIVSDNNSKDKTKQIVLDFVDHRIHYYRNKRNIGLTKNLQNALRYVKGKYVLLLGDEDIIVFDSFLQKAKSLLDKTGVGFLRINWIEESLQKGELEKKLLRVYRNIQIQPNNEPTSIMKFLFSINVGGMTGLILKNTKFIKQKFLSTENSAWYPLVYETVKNYGGYFASHMYIIVRWYLPGTHQQLEAYMVQNNRLNVEPLINTCVSFSRQENHKTIRNMILSPYIGNILSIKLYTNNRNVIRFVQRLLTLDFSYIVDYRIWVYTPIALILPIKLLYAIRYFHHKTINEFSLINNKENILRRYLYLKKIYYRELS